MLSWISSSLKIVKSYLHHRTFIIIIHILSSFLNILKSYLHLTASPNFIIISEYHQIFIREPHILSSSLGAIKWSSPLKIIRSLTNWSKSRLNAFFARHLNLGKQWSQERQELAVQKRLIQIPESDSVGKVCSLCIPAVKEADSYCSRPSAPETPKSDHQPRPNRQQRASVYGVFF